MPVQYWLVWTEWYGLFTIFIPVYCFLLMPAVTALQGDTERFLERVSAQQWAVMLSVYCISHVPALLTLAVPGFEGRNLLLIAFLIITVQGSDVLQYIFGKLFGRRKVAPPVSPSKTWEGLIGGIATASLLGAGLSFLTPFSPLQAAMVAFLICLMGFFGGPGRLGDQARPGRQGLGPSDRGPRRHARPGRQSRLRRPDLLSHRALFLDGLTAYSLITMLVLVAPNVSPARRIHVHRAGAAERSHARPDGRGA